MTVVWLTFGVFTLLCVAAHFAIKRARRGERFILDQLARGPMYGLELVDCSGGLLKRGTVYVLLGRLQDRGLVVAKKGCDGRRLYFALNAIGRTNHREGS